MDNFVVKLIFEGFGETLFMSLLSTLISYAIGIPMGILLFLTKKGGLKQNTIVYRILDIIINILRSVPFLILLITISPLTQIIVGTMIGTEATVVPLVFAAAPFIARLIESSFNEVQAGVIEASRSMGASTTEIIFKVLIPETRPGLIIGVAIAFTSIIGYSAMAGFAGGGGLGDIAIRYGLHRFQKEVMYVTVAVLVLIVQVFQIAGLWLAKKLDRRIRG